MMLFLLFLSFFVQSETDDNDKYLTDYIDSKMNYNISFDQIVIPGEIVCQTYNSIKIKVLDQHDKRITQMIEGQIYYIFKENNPDELYMVENLIDQLKIKPPSQIPYFNNLVSLVNENEESRFWWKKITVKFPNFLTKLVEIWFRKQKQKLAFEYSYTYEYHYTFESYHYQNKKSKKGTGTIIELSLNPNRNFSLTCKLLEAEETVSEALSKRYTRINEIVDNFHEEIKKNGDILPILSELCQEFEYCFTKIIQTEKNKTNRENLVNSRNNVKNKVNKFINNSLFNFEKYTNIYGFLIPTFMVFDEISGDQRQKTECFYLNYNQFEYLKQKFPDDTFVKNTINAVKKVGSLAYSAIKHIPFMNKKGNDEMDDELEKYNTIKNKMEKAKPIMRDIINGVPNCDDHNILIKIEKNTKEVLKLVNVLPFFNNLEITA